MIRRLKVSRNLKWVPNAITLCNSLCGFAAILYTLRVYDTDSLVKPMSVYAVSAYIILGAMIFDALDGYVARVLNASSLEGVEIDSLADMVTFGLAPATIVAIMTHALIVSHRHSVSAYQEILIYGLCSIYIGGAALRLAKYNIKALFPQKESTPHNPEYFSGLPSPGAASAICAVVLVAPQYDISVKYLGVFLPIYAAFLGLLMVSNIPYVHAARWLLSIRRNRKRLISFCLIMLFIVICSCYGKTLTALAIIFTLYIFSGVFNLMVQSFKKTIKGI